MKPAQFAYVRPSSVEEAVTLLAEYGDDAKALAGGQSLVPLMNFRLARPKLLVDINTIDGLAYVREDDGWLALGALTRERAVEKSELVASRLPLLSEATRWIGHPPIRSRGTIGGSLAHNDPSAEYPLIATALGAEVVVQGSGGRRRVPIDDFFVTYLTTSLAPDELVVEVRFPVPASGTGWAFQEMARRRGDFAIVAAAALLSMDGETISGARIAVGGAAPIAFRATDAESVLVGQRWSTELAAEAAVRAAAMTDPEGDIHGSADYRRHLAGVLTRQALALAPERAERNR